MKRYLVENGIAMTTVHAQDPDAAATAAFEAGLYPPMSEGGTHAVRVTALEPLTTEVRVSQSFAVVKETA